MVILGISSISSGKRNKNLSRKRREKRGKKKKESKRLGKFRKKKKRGKKLKNVLKKFACGALFTLIKGKRHKTLLRIEYILP